MITLPKEGYKSNNSNITVVVMTALSSFHRSYSLTTVIIDQLRALVVAGYKVKFWVMANCNMEFFPDDLAIAVDVKKVMPSVSWKTDEIDKDGAIKIKETIDQNLLTMESAVVITHDLLFIDSFVTFSHVAHSLIPNSKFKWFHCCHSSVSIRPTGPVKRLRSSLPHGHKIICLNRNLVAKFATYYGTTADRIAVVNNSRDIRAFADFPRSIWDLVHKSGILTADVVQTYAFSTLRADAKGLEHVIRVLGVVKKFGLNVKLILLNAHATDHRAKPVFDKYNALIKECGLDGDVTWHSNEFKDKDAAYHGASERVVSSLMQVSNLFIFPTVSEAGPLVLMEASLSGCLLVLNKQVEALYDYIPSRCALYYEFTPANYKEIATNIAHFLSNNVMNLSKRHTLKHHSILSMAKQLQNVINKV